jgi:hypothetical protein
VRLADAGLEMTREAAVPAISAPRSAATALVVRFVAL